MTTVKHVPIGAIKANPWRRLGDYPYVPEKIEALKRSIDDVGLWEGIIGRAAGNGAEIAFGHHRLEAARQLGAKTIPVIIRTDLTDEMMLKFMGRENMEDYNADFLCQFETWEAAAKYAGGAGFGTQTIDIAKLLGWTVQHSKDGHAMMNDTARACAAAHALVADNHMAREDFKNLTVRTAREITERVNTRISQIAKMAAKSNLPAAQIKAAKKQVAKAGKYTAKRVRKGEVLQKDIATTVDVETYRFAKEAKVKTPTFEKFIKVASNAVAKMLKDDSAAKRITEIVKVLGDIVSEDDRMEVGRLDYELNGLSKRIEGHQKALIPVSKKVTYLPVQGGKS